MQILRQESRLEMQLLSDKQSLYVPIRQRSIEFCCRYIPMESDPTKEPSLETAIQDMRSLPASRHASGAQ